MAVLVIRAHKRFGVCRGITLRGGQGGPRDGLLIEVSLEGCRISNVNSDLFAFEDCVEVEIAGWKTLRTNVRWNHNGMVGLRLVQPLHKAELADLLNFCRGTPATQESRRA